MYFIAKLPGLISSNNKVFSNLCQVLINNGFTPDKEDYELCTKIENMIIPTEGFFGISAATGGLAGIILLPLPNTYRMNFNKMFCSLVTFPFSSSHITGFYFLLFSHQVFYNLLNEQSEPRFYIFSFVNDEASCNFFISLCCTSILFNLTFSYYLKYICDS